MFDFLNGYKTKISVVGFGLIGVLEGLQQFAGFVVPDLLFTIALPLFAALGLYGLRDKLERIKPEA